MPVIGHAIVGVAAAVTSRRAAPRAVAAGSGVWALCLVSLSYVPDVVEQVVGFSGWQHASLFSHSLACALAAGIALAPLVARVAGIGLRRSAIVATAAILVHDVLDLLQSPDRMPGWPMSTWRVPHAAALIPSSLAGEIVVFAPLVIGAWLWRRHNGPPAISLRRSDLAAWATVAAIAGGAATVNALRDARQQDLLRARALVAAGNYAGALAACDRADRWPSTAAPGRLDYIRAEAWLGLGARERAEHYYLSSRHKDPTYFWTVADLAVLYASGRKPVDERRRDAAPWIDVLESDFARHPALSRTLERVRRRLQQDRR